MLWNEYFQHGKIKSNLHEKSIGKSNQNQQKRCLCGSIKHLRVTSKDCPMGLSIRKAKNWPWGWVYINPKQRSRQKMNQKRNRENFWRQRPLGRVKKIRWGDISSKCGIKFGFWGSWGRWGSWGKWGWVFLRRPGISNRSGHCGMDYIHWLNYGRLFGVTFRGYTILYQFALVWSKKLAFYAMAGIMG